MADITISGLSQGIPDKNTAIIPYSDGSTTYKTSPSAIVAASPGSVLQVVQAYKTDLWSTTTRDTWQTVPGLTVSITVKSLLNRVLVEGNITGGRSFFGEGGGYDAVIRLLKNNVPTGNSSAGYIGQFAGVEQYESSVKSFRYLDNITQLSNTYTIQFYLFGGAGSVGYINARGAFGDFVSVSDLTLTEIAG